MAHLSKTRKLTLIGIMAALTFAASWISINIPTPVGNTRLHLGNVLCLLSGMLLGAVPGGLAAGIGSMFFDFTNPLYIASAPFTLAFKFMMGFLCGAIVWRKDGLYSKRVGVLFLAGICGAFSYVVLYLSKNFLEDVFFLRTEMQTAVIDVGTKALTSGVNAILAFVVAVPLAIAVRKGLETAGMYHSA
jgi:uncharacterized membrane protein